MQKRKHTDAWKIHASEVAREWYHKNKERLKQERAKGKKEGVMKKLLVPHEACLRFADSEILNKSRMQ